MGVWLADAFQSSKMTCNEPNTCFNDILGDSSLQETDNHPYVLVNKIITKDLTWNGTNTSTKLLPQPTVLLHL